MSKFIKRLYEHQDYVVERIRDELSESGAMDKMHKELPKLKEEIGEITAQKLEDLLK